MNRVIRFRAWDKKHKRIITYHSEVIDFCLGLTKNKKGCYETNCHANPKCEEGKSRDFTGGFLTNCPYLIWMQYVGLADKHHKDIFDGDIVKWDGSIWRVCYHPMFYGYTLESHEGRVLMSDAIKFTVAETHKHPYSNDIEIIGNDYENPELLESV